MGLIDEIRNLTNASRAKLEEQQNEEIESEKARRKWLKETQIPKIARKYYKEILGKIKDTAKVGDDGIDYSIEHYGKPSRLDEEIFPALRAVRKKLIKDGFEVSEINDKTEKVHNTDGVEDYRIACSIAVQW